MLGGMVWYGTIRYGTVRYGMDRYGMVWYGTVWYGIAGNVYCCKVVLVTADQKVICQIILHLTLHMNSQPGIVWGQRR